MPKTWFTNSIHQKMFKCHTLYEVMKITKKKGIFSLYSHNMKKKFNESHFVTVDLMFLLKVFIINKSKDTQYKYISNSTL